MSRKIGKIRAFVIFFAFITYYWFTSPIFPMTRTMAPCFAVTLRTSGTRTCPVIATTHTRYWKIIYNSNLMRQWFCDYYYQKILLGHLFVRSGMKSWMLYSPPAPLIGDETTSGSMKIKAAPKIKMVDL